MKILSQSKHRNIVNYVDSFIENNKKVVYIVMEYVRGLSLFECLSDRK
jgi:serine/threonine protein kinase